MRLLRKQWIIIAFVCEIMLLSLSSLFLFTFSPKQTKNNFFESIPKNPLIQINLNTNDNSLTAKDIIQSSFIQYFFHCRNSDYLKPISKTCANSSSLSITAFESLDALYLAGLEPEYKIARKYVLEMAHPSNSDYINTYELSTKVIGGLLSIYSLTGDILFLKKAEEFADLLLHAFHDSVFPYPFINGVTGEAQPLVFTDGTFLSESSGFLLEFASLYEITGDIRYKRAIDKYTHCLATQSDKLRYGQWSLESCSPIGDYVGLTPLTASFYSNMLKKELYFPSAEGENITSSIISIISKLKNTDFPTLYEIEHYSGYMESYCEINTLIDKVDPSADHKKLQQVCKDIRHAPFPHNKRMQDISDDFNYETSYYSENWNRTVSSASLNKCICEDALCSLSSYSGSKQLDLMPSAAISRFLKFILLNKAEFPQNKFVINEAGHFLPLRKE